MTFDRAAEESRLVAGGAPGVLVSGSRGWDLTGVRRMIARHQRFSGPDEQAVFRDRFLSLQPSLDQTSYQVVGATPR
ncbi:MAG: hypothetical protein ACXW15_06725 [Acidimicrobiia bacterium]